MGNTLRWANTGGSADLIITRIEKTDATPVWQIVSPGNLTELNLPDPATLGLPGWPSEPLNWLQWHVKLENFDYNTYNYTHQRSSYWTRWSFDQFSLRISSP